MYVVYPLPATANEVWLRQSPGYFVIGGEESRDIIYGSHSCIHGTQRVHVTWPRTEKSRKYDESAVFFTEFTRAMHAKDTDIIIG